MRKRIVYADGTDSIIEGDISISGKKVVSEEDLSYLPEKDFKKIAYNPKKYKLKNKKVSSVQR